MEYKEIMDSEITLTLSSRTLVDIYRAVRATMSQLEPYSEDPGIRAYLQRLSDIHSWLIDATIASGQDGT